jgi:hypothetical protein
MDTATLQALSQATLVNLADETPKENSLDTVSTIAAKMYAGKKQIYAAAQTVADKEHKQFINDFQSFVISQKGAIDHGNTNACQVNHTHQKNHQTISVSHNQSTTTAELPDTRTGTLYNTKPRHSAAKIVIPRTASHPTGTTRPTGLGKSKYNQLTAPLVSNQTRVVRKVEPIESDSKKHHDRFVEAVAGRRDRSATDGAIIFSRHGTPIYGSQITQRAEQQNVSANLATNQPASLGIPQTIKTGEAIPAKTTAKTEVQGTSNTGQRLATGVALVAIAGAIAAIMWACQGLVVLVAFITQMGLIVTQVGNITQLVKMAWEGVTSILGLEKQAKDAGNFFEDNISKIFGSKENYLKTKFTFLRISNVISAATNSLASIQSATQTVADAVAEHSNNTSRMGNAMRSVGMFGDKLNHFNEQVQLQVTGRFAGLANTARKLGVASSVSSEMVQVIDNVKTVGEQEKELSEREKQELEENEKKLKEQKEKLEGDKTKNAPKVSIADV